MSDRLISYYPGELGEPLHWVLPVPDRSGRYLTACGMLCPLGWKPKAINRQQEHLHLACPACTRALDGSIAKRVKEERGMYERRP